MDDQVRLVLEHTRWPGNLRQLDMEMREAVRRADAGLVRAMHLAPQRLTDFYGSRHALRLASEVLAWGHGGEAPTDEQLVARTEAALSTIRRPMTEEQEPEVGLLVQVRSAFDENDKPHALLGRLVDGLAAQRALTTEGEALKKLHALLPGAAQALIQTRIQELAAEQQSVDTSISEMAAELSSRLPGLFNVFQIVQSLPGVSEREKMSLFKALATIIQFMMVILPTFAAQGIQRLASKTFEDHVLDVDEEHDPNNPFLREIKPEDRADVDWAWLAENTSSLREAADLSGHSRNTVKHYFERYNLNPPRIGSTTHPRANRT
jgi:hypothetical protein